MKYLLFTNFSTGLKHNSEYNSLKAVYESIQQLVEDENLDIKAEMPQYIEEIEKHLDENDDYVGQLSNGTWYHIQPHPVFV